MTVIIAIGIGMLMTAVAVAIAGLALELVLNALNRSLANNAMNEQSGTTAIIEFKPSGGPIDTMEWAEEAAA